MRKRRDTGNGGVSWLNNIAKYGLWPVLVVVIGAWLLGWLNEFVPSPARTSLAATNHLGTKQARSEDRYRFVLCWLQNDRNGIDTRVVAQAFSSIQGISLVRSARIVTASGAADDWRPAIQRSARAVLTQWNADLAIVGAVKQPGEVLSLWFVPRMDGGTLERGDRPYVLEDATLGDDFHDDLQAQLAVVALTAVGSLADTAARQRVLSKDLRIATDKLAKLTKNSAGRRAEYQAAMEAGLSTALVALGRMETGTESFERAIEGYRAALEVFTRERYPEHWGQTMNDLGVALVAIAERETGTERLKEAAFAYRAALKERTRDRAPLGWAQTQNNLGNVLAKIGERESNAARLEEAIATYREVLQERPRNEEPLGWAMIKNNLANALVRLYRLEGGSEHLDEGIATYWEALGERTRNRVPRQWAQTQKNLGGALVARGERDGSAENLNDAVDVFRAVLEVHTRDHLPLDWAGAQIGLGASLRALAKQEDSPERLEEAIGAYQAALQVLRPEWAPLAWAVAQHNLGNALLDLAPYENSTKHLREASEAYQSALDVLTLDNGSARFRDEVKKLLDHTLELLNSR